MKHAWLSEISKQLIPKSEVPPKGYVCAKEAAKELGVSVKSARRTLEKGMAMNKLNRVSVRIHNGKQGQGSTFMPVWYYGKK